MGIIKFWLNYRIRKIVILLTSKKEYCIVNKLQLENISAQVRRDIIRMTNFAKSGHPGGSLGCTDLLTVLFFDLMKIHPPDFKMNGIGEDVFILSNGHISPVYYSILARRGYFPVSELASFRKLGTRLQGHPATAEELPGIRISTGSLGQGLSVAAGLALAKKSHKDQRFVFVLQGDGELQEGQNWEAFMFAAHHKIDNLISIIDCNNKQIDGNVDDVMSLKNLNAKIESFGWIVLEMNGHDHEIIRQTLDEAKNKCGNLRPVCILMKSIMGKGIDFMENDHKWHGVAPDDQQRDLALAQLKETLGDF